MAVNIFELFGKIGADDQPAMSAIDKVVGHAKTADRTLSTGLDKIGSFATGIGTKLSLGLTTPVIALGTSAVKTGIQFNLFKQQSKLAFTTMLGSAEAAQGFMDEMYQFALKTPFAYPDLLQSAKTMKAFGFETESIIPTLETLGDAVIATGGSSKDIEGLATVFGQISSNGRLALQDVNQLTTRGIPALDIIANKSGKTVMQIRDDISDGSIESKDAIDMLVDGIANGTEGVAGSTAKFGGLMGEMKGTLTGSLDTMKSAWRNAFAAMTETMSESGGTLQQLVSNITRIFKTLPSIFGGTFESIENGLSGFSDLLGNVADKLENMDEKQLKAIGSMGAFAIALGPGLVVGGQFLTGLSKIAYGFETVSSVASGIGDVVGKVVPSLDGIKGVGSTIGTAFDTAKGKVSTFSTAFSQFRTGSNELFRNFIPDSMLSKFDTFSDKIKSIPVSGFEAVGDKIGMLDFRMGTFLGRFDGTGVYGKIDALKGRIGSISPTLSKVSTGASTMLSQSAGAVTGVVSRTTNALGTVMSLAMSAIGPAAIGGLLLVGLGLLNSQFGDQLDGLIQTAVTKGPEIIGGLTAKVREGIPEFIMSGAELLTGFGEALTTNLPAIFGLATTIITGLVDGVTQALPMLIPMAVQIITGLANGIITAVPQLLMAGLNLLQGLIDGIVQNLPLIANSASEIVNNLSTQLQLHLPTILEKGINILVSLVDGIAQAIPKLAPIVLRIFVTIIQAIVTNLPQIISGGIKILDSLINGVTQVIPKLIPMIAQVFAQIVQAIVSNLPQILQKGIELLGKLGAGIIQAIPQLIGLLPQVFSAIRSAFSDVDWGSVGKNIIDGIAAGIANFAGSIVTAAKNAASAAFEGAKSFLGIHSPSRLFRDGIGVFISQGIAEGVTKDAGTIQSALTSAADDLTFDPSLGGGMFDPNAMNVGGYGYNAQPQSDFNQEVLAMLANMIDLLYALLEKDNDVYIDGQRATDILKQRISEAIRELNDRNSYNNGIVPKPI